LGSVHTRNFPALLQQLKASLLATTFQQQKLVVLRGDAHGLHSEFIALDKPMGLAADARRIVVGGRDRVYEFRNMPTLVVGSESRADHDALFLLRNIHVSGGIDIHEIAFADEECWCVNTRFSCLCTLDQRHSFVPRWRPRFITRYAPEDRCHLNGFAMEGGRPRFATALGESNTLEGWREFKRDGGIMLDVESGEIVARGLSMPHSPRIHGGRLWFLESGRGSLATMDPANGRVETVIKLPGYTRGLDLIGPLAFVGLSQLRKTNPFVDVPLTDENPDRSSGIWVVNIETAKTVAFLRFSGSVEEIFAVQLLRGAARPSISAQDSEALETMWVLPDAAIPEVEFASSPRPVPKGIRKRFSRRSERWREG
jgi:uncharacterized protein (TIGR03032 family)